MPTLIVVCGTSFAGKSTLARLIADRFGHPDVDVDATKAGLFGDAVDEAALSRADWARIYAETDRLIAAYIDSGRSVIDASRNFTRAERERAKTLCREHRATLVTVHVAAPEEVTRQRLLDNRRSPTRRDVSDDAFEAILTGWEPPTADEGGVAFRFGEDPAEWMTAHAGVLSGRGA